jgi:putative membrane protein
LLLPLVTKMGWFTPMGSTLVGFIFLALEKIARDLEDPFENTIYDVPLTAITTTIEINLRQLPGETEQGQKPVRGGALVDLRSKAKARLAPGPFAFEG